MKLRDNSLAGGKVSSRQQDQGALAGHAKPVHFAVGTNSVWAGVGSGIGAKNQPVIELYGEAISHLVGVIFGDQTKRGST
jgi:hypothetical protein